MILLNKNDLENKINVTNNNLEKRLKGIELTICKIGNRKPQKEDTGKSEFEKKFEEKEKIMKIITNFIQK